MSPLVITIVVFLFISLCLLTGKLPASVACGVGVAVLWATGVINQQEAFVNFVGDNIVTMIGMMILVTALLKTSILKHIAGLVRKSKGGGITILLIASMAIPFLLGQFIGGVTALITVIPLAMALAEEAGISPTKLVLPASVGAQAGLMGIPIGSAAAMYLMKNEMIANVGGTETLGFWDLCGSRLPGTIAVFVFVILFGHRLLPSRELAGSDMLDANKAKAVLKESDLPKWKETVTYVIFFGTMILMCFSRNMGLSNTMISVVSAFLVVVLGIINEREMYQGVNWSLVFVMGFMLAVATALSNSGAGEILATAFSAVYGSGNPIFAMAATFIFCVILTQFMDNMSLINILTPIAIIACMESGISALPIICAIDASCLASFSTPLASPSSLMAYNLGGYSMKEMLKFTLPCVLIATVVSIIWIPIWFSIAH